MKSQKYFHNLQVEPRKTTSKKAPISAPVAKIDKKYHLTDRSNNGELEIKLLTEKYDFYNNLFLIKF